MLGHNNNEKNAIYSDLVDSAPFPFANFHGRYWLKMRNVAPPFARKTRVAPTFLESICATGLNAAYELFERAFFLSLFLSYVFRLKFRGENYVTLA